MLLSKQYALPRFFFTHAPQGAEREEPVSPKPLLEVDGLCVCFDDYLIHCDHRVDEQRATVILGHPVVGERIDREAVFQGTAKGLDPDFLRSLGGEFLLLHLDRATGRLQAATDRFPSIPLYYARVGNVLAGSVFYNDLWRWLGEKNARTPDPAVFFEFVWFQRIMGRNTYDTASEFLPGATALTRDHDHLSEQAFWTHSFEKTTDSLDHCAHDLAEALKRSVRRKLSDDPGRHGLFLSGGKDSRSVLASFEEPPVCFTVAVSKNNEWISAHQATEARGAEHVYLELPPDPYTRHLDELVQLSSGMYAYDHALFHGFADQVREHADVVFHGHGIDYMFQGMYVPAKVVRIWGKTQWRTLAPFSGDMVHDFMHTISYRLKHVDLLDYVLPARREEMYGTLRDSVGRVVEAGSSFCNTDHDVWEWLLIHAIARHYPYTNLYSMGTCAEQRTPTFDNDVFDLYLSLPAKYRLNARMAIKLLTVLSPEMAAIRNNNTGMPAGYQAWQREMFVVKHRMLKKLGLLRKNPYNKSDADRTWPHRLTLLQEKGPLYQAAMDMCRSEALAGLGIWDMDRIARDIPSFIDNPPHRNIGGIVAYLLTIDRFLRQ